MIKLVGSRLNLKQTQILQVELEGVKEGTHILKTIIYV